MTQPFAYAVVLDFEATCDDTDPPSPQEIIEFPSVLVDLERLKPVHEFEAFVRPRHHPTLTDFCRALTSIQQKDVDSAPLFPAVFEAHQNWMSEHELSIENAILVTCGDWDLRTMLPAQCAVTEPVTDSVPPLYTRWHNVKNSFRKVTGLNRAPGMPGMLQHQQLPLKGRHHRGIDDSRNIAALLIRLIKNGAEVGVTGELDTS